MKFITRNGRVIPIRDGKEGAALSHTGVAEVKSRALKVGVAAGVLTTPVGGVIAYHFSKRSGLNKLAGKK